MSNLKSLENIAKKEVKVTIAKLFLKKEKTVEMTAEKLKVDFKDLDQLNLTQEID